MDFKIHKCFHFGHEFLIRIAHFGNFYSPLKKWQKNSIYKMSNKNFQNHEHSKTRVQYFVIISAMLKERVWFVLETKCPEA